MFIKRRHRHRYPLSGNSSSRHRKQSLPVTLGNLLRLLLSVGRRLSSLPMHLLLLIGLLWVIGLIIYQPFAALPLIPVLLLMLYLRRRDTPGSLKLWLWCILGVSMVTYHFLPPPQPTAWQTPWAKEPQFLLKGETLTISNLRDFRYRSTTDYDVRYRTESYDLNTLTDVCFAECHWDGHLAICHTMLAFRFADGRTLVVSPETRLPVGEAQNALAGIYKRYGLLYVFGTAEDLFALRTNYRHEDLKLFPMNLSATQARDLLLRMVREAEETHSAHTPYHTVANNCSSGILRILSPSANNIPWGYKWLPVHNGSISRILYSYNALRHRSEESFDSLSRRAYLGYDLPMGETGEYSRAIDARLAP